MKSESNGHLSSNPDLRGVPAKWILGESGKIPRLAFAIPPEELDHRALLAAPKGEGREKFVREYVEGQLRGRYGGAVKNFKADRDTARDGVTYLENDCHRLIAERKKIDYLELETKPGFEVPRGQVGVCAALMILIAVALPLSEWLNAAGFAARHEMQSLFQAMSFTFVFAVAALALKFASARLRVGIVLCGIGFLALYAKYYVSDEAGESATIVLNQLLDSPPATQSLSPSLKPLLLILQVVTSTLVALALVSAIGRITFTPPKHQRNRDLKMLDEYFDKVLEKLGNWRRKVAEPEGNLDEFEHSIAVYTKNCLGLLAKLEELKKTEADFFSVQQQQIASLKNELSGGSSLPQQTRN